jgi:hypothetical protein
MSDEIQELWKAQKETQKMASQKGGKSNSKMSSPMKGLQSAMKGKIQG